MSEERQKPAERFMAKVEKTDDCWLWWGGRNGDGYGVFMVSKTPQVFARAHRFAYEHFIGPIPPGYQTDHVCRVRACVNPFHLDLVTSRENTIRGHRARNRCRNGHEKTPDNIYVNAKGHRDCRTCRLEKQRARRAHLRAEREAAIA